MATASANPSSVTLAAGVADSMRVVFSNRMLMRLPPSDDDAPEASLPPTGSTRSRLSGIIDALRQVSANAARRNPCSKVRTRAPRDLPLGRGRVAARPELLQPRATVQSGTARSATPGRGSTRGRRFRYTSESCRRNPLDLRKWRNWQTRKPQELVPARGWRFEPSLPHHSFRPVSSSSESAFKAESTRCRPSWMTTVQRRPTGGHASPGNATLVRLVSTRPAGTATPLI